MKHHDKDADEAAKKAKEEHDEKVAEDVLGFFNAGAVIEAPGRPADEPVGGPVDEDHSA